MRKLVALFFLTFLFAASAASAQEANQNFIAKLSGDDEVPPKVTKAHGMAAFEVINDGTAIAYTLNVANIENVFGAHIHVGEAGTNGDVVVHLYGPAPPGGGRVSGNIAKGIITAADLVGPLAGQPLSALIERMASGGTYVNVHTNDGVAPAGTGPGDFPSGEIRGQIRPSD